jgi:uncharacterized delta-60 repeat protein
MLSVCCLLLALQVMADARDSRNSSRLNNPVNTIPEIVTQPASQITDAGATASFACAAIGTPPPGFQWRYSGQLISGQTNASLQLTNLQPSQSGSYSVVVSNVQGIVSSEPAYLFVRPPSSPGTVDLSFDPRTGVDYASLNHVHAIQLQGDKILIAGWFPTYNGIRVDNIARLNSDGSLDPSFKATGCSDYIEVVKLDGNGRIYVGGSFFRFNGVPRNLLVRLNPDGSLDETFAPEPFVTRVFERTVNALLLQSDGKVLVGGCLDSISCLRGVLRLNPDGSSDPTWIAPTTDLWVTDMAAAGDDKITVGGRASFGTQTSQGMVLRLNSSGEIDPTFAPFTASQWVNKLLPLDDGRIVVGFWYAAKIPALGTYANYVALTTSGEVDTSFVTTNNTRLLMDGVNGMLPLTSDSFLIAGGGAPLAGSFLGICYTNGTLDPNFRPTIKWETASMALQPDGKLLIGGKFERVNGLSRRGIARLNLREQVVSPLLAGPLVTPEWFQLWVPTSTNHLFQLESSDAARGPNWVPITSFQGDGKWRAVRDPSPNATRRFYRVRVN